MKNIFNLNINRRNLTVLLLFFSAYIILIETGNEKHLPLPYFFIEIGYPLEYISRGQNGGNIEWLLYLILLVSHLSLLVLIKKKASKILNILLPLIFIALIFLFSIIKIEKFTNISTLMFYSIVPYITIWLYLIYIVSLKTYNNKPEY